MNYIRISVGRFSLIKKKTHKTPILIILIQIKKRIFRIRYTAYTTVVYAVNNILLPDMNIYNNNNIIILPIGENVVQTFAVVGV